MLQVFHSRSKTYYNATFLFYNYFPGSFQMTDGFLAVVVVWFLSCSLKSIYQNFILHDAESHEADHYLGHVAVIPLQV